MIVDQITTKIQATYTNGYEVAKAIEDRMAYDFNIVKPKLGLDEKEQEEEYDKNQKIPREKVLIYEKAVDAWIKRQNIYEANMKKAYSFTYQDHCTAAMRNMIQKLPNFQKIKNDPVKLLEEVQKLMHISIQAIYLFMGLIEALARLLYMLQCVDEKLNDYGDCFKSERQIVRSLLGNEFLGKFIENTEEF